jgi:hypothetical protein
MPEASNVPQPAPPHPPDSSHNDVIGILAETIQAQGEAYGRIDGGLNDLKNSNIKIVSVLKKVAKKLKIKDDDDEDDDDGGKKSSARSWTENKLLLIFMIIMGLALLVQAGAKIPEITKMFKAAHGISDKESKSDKDEEK